MSRIVGAVLGAAFGAMLGIGAGYLLAMAIAAFVPIDVQSIESASLILALSCCSVCGLLGVTLSALLTGGWLRPSTN